MDSYKSQIVGLYNCAKPYSCHTPGEFTEHSSTVLTSDSGSASVTSESWNFPLFPHPHNTYDGTALDNTPSPFPPIFLLIHHSQSPYKIISDFAFLLHATTTGTEKRILHFEYRVYFCFTINSNYFPKLIGVYESISVSKHNNLSLE
jgi:hypothetical protein